MRVLQNRHRNVYSICTWKIWVIDFIKNVAKWKGSYKPCNNTCSPKPTQTHPYSSLTSQQMVILTHNHPENVTPTHIHSHPAKNWSHLAKKCHTLPHITERTNVMCLIHDTYMKSIPFPALSVEPYFVKISYNYIYIIPRFIFTGIWMPCAQKICKNLTQVNRSRLPYSFRRLV